MLFVHKSNSSKWKTAFGRQGDSKRAQGRNTLGKYALSAGLVDRGHSGVQNDCLQSVPARGDRRNDPRRSRSDNDDLASIRHNQIIRCALDGWSCAAAAIGCK